MPCEICLAVRVGRSSSCAAARPWKNAAAAPATRTAATSKHDQCNAIPKLAMANTAASTSSKTATMPNAPATTIQTLARRRDAIFSVISVLASCSSLRSRSARSARRSVRACTSPEFRRSCAMELSRAALEALGPAVLFRRFFRRTALEHAEREEAGEAGEAEHQRGLLAGEIRSRSYEILDGPSAQILRELLRAVRHAANETGELWSVSFEILRGHTCGVHNVADHIGAGSDLHIEKT